MINFSHGEALVRCLRLPSPDNQMLFSSSPPMGGANLITKTLRYCAPPILLAKKFLDGELVKYKIWKDARNDKFITTLFGNAGNFERTKQAGVGRSTILKFLGGNWKQKLRGMFEYPLSPQVDSGKKYKGRANVLQDNPQAPKEDRDEQKNKDVKRFIKQFPAEGWFFIHQFLL